jgi:hypothetical protein
MCKPETFFYQDGHATNIVKDQSMCVRVHNYVQKFQNTVQAAVPHVV